MAEHHHPHRCLVYNPPKLTIKRKTREGEASGGGRGSAQLVLQAWRSAARDATRRGSEGGCATLYSQSTPAMPVTADAVRNTTAARHCRGPGSGRRARPQDRRSDGRTTKQQGRRDRNRDSAGQLAPTPSGGARARGEPVVFGVELPARGDIVFSVAALTQLITIADQAGVEAADDLYAAIAALRRRLRANAVGLPPALDDMIERLARETPASDSGNNRGRGSRKPTVVTRASGRAESPSSIAPRSLGAERAGAGASCRAVRARRGGRRRNTDAEHWRRNTGGGDPQGIPLGLNLAFKHSAKILN